MNKKFKLTLVFVAVLAIALLAQSGAWAGKLQSSNEAPSVAVNEAGIRPQGTSQGQTAKVVSGGSGLSGIIHNKMVTAANVNRPDGTYYALYNNKQGATISVAVGPNFSGTVSYYLNGWHTVRYTTVNNVITFTVPPGAQYIAITP